MLNVAMLNVALLNVPMLNVAMLNVPMLNVAMLNVPMLNVARLNDVRLSVAAPLSDTYTLVQYLRVMLKFWQSERSTLRTSS